LIFGDNLGVEYAVVLGRDCPKRGVEARLGLEYVRLEIGVPRAKVRDPPGKTISINSRLENYLDPSNPSVFQGKSQA